MIQSLDRSSWNIKRWNHQQSHKQGSNPDHCTITFIGCNDQQQRPTILPLQIKWNQLPRYTRINNI